MKNKDIIIAKAKEIFGEDEVEAMLGNGEDIPLHTLKTWKEMYPDVVLRTDAVGVKVLLWNINPKNQKLYRKETTLYTMDEIII